MPYDLVAGQQVVLSVERNGLRSASVELLLVDARPGLFRTGGPTPYAVAFDQDNVPITESNRAVRGKSIVLHATGLGRVTSPPELGERAKIETLSHVTKQVRVWFGGEAVAPTFAGLAPGQAGLYQIDVTIPTSVSPDNGIVEVSVEVDGIRGTLSRLPVLP